MPAEKDTKGAGDKDGEKEAPIRALDAQDIAFLKNYGLGPYATSIKKAEADLKDIMKRVNDLCGVKESDTGLAPPSRWDLVSDKQMMQEEQPLQVHGVQGMGATSACMCGCCVWRDWTGVQAVIWAVSGVEHGQHWSTHQHVMCAWGLRRDRDGGMLVCRLRAADRADHQL